MGPFFEKRMLLRTVLFSNNCSNNKKIYEYIQIDFHFNSDSKIFGKKKKATQSWIKSLNVFELFVQIIIIISENYQNFPLAN